MTKKLIRTPASARRISVVASNARGTAGGTSVPPRIMGIIGLKDLPNGPEPTREISREVDHLRAHVSMASDLLRELSMRLAPVLAITDSRNESGTVVTPVAPDTPLGTDLRSISDEVVSLTINLRSRLSQLQL